MATEENIKMKLYNKGNREFITGEGMLKPGKTLEVPTALGKILVNGYREIVEFKNIGVDKTSENLDTEKKQLEKEKAELQKQKAAFEKEQAASKKKLFGGKK